MIQSAITQDIELFNEYPKYWVKIKVEAAMQEDWYDGRYDNFYQKNLPIMQYQTYLHSIHHEPSDLVVSDENLGNDYVELCYSYLDKVVA